MVPQPIKKKFNLSGEKEKGGGSGHEAGRPILNVIQRRSAEKQARVEQDRLRLDAIAAREEKERRLQLEETRKEIASLARGARTVASETTHVQGWASLLQRVIVNEQNPEMAKKLVQFAKREAVDHNEAVLALRQDRDEYEAKRGKLAGELGEKPLSTRPVGNLSEKAAPSEDGEGRGKKAFKKLGTGFLRVGNGTANFVVSGLLSLINGTPDQVADEIRLDEKGLHAMRPMKAVRDASFKPEEADSLTISVDSAKWWDPVAKFVLRFNSDFRWTPVGRVVIIDRYSGDERGSAVTIRPDKKAKELKEKFEALKEYPVREWELPEMKPEPTEADLLSPRTLEARETSGRSGSPARRVPNSRTVSRGG